MCQMVRACWGVWQHSQQKVAKLEDSLDGTVRSRLGNLNSKEKLGWNYVWQRHVTYRKYIIIDRYLCGCVCAHACVWLCAAVTNTNTFNLTLNAYCVPSTVLESVVWISQDSLSSECCCAFCKQAWPADAGLLLFAYKGIKNRAKQHKSQKAYKPMGLLWDSR